MILNQKHPINLLNKCFNVNGTKIWKPLNTFQQITSIYNEYQISNLWIDFN